MILHFLNTTWSTWFFSCCGFVVKSQSNVALTNSVSLLLSLRKQESGDVVRSMDLPYVGEDEALSWYRCFNMHTEIFLPVTAQHNTPLLTFTHFKTVSLQLRAESLRMDVKDVIWGTLATFFLTLNLFSSSCTTQLEVVGFVTVTCEPQLLEILPVCLFFSPN